MNKQEERIFGTRQGLVQWGYVKNGETKKNFNCLSQAPAGLENHGDESQLATCLFFFSTKQPCLSFSHGIMESWFPFKFHLQIKKFLEY